MKFKKLIVFTVAALIFTALAVATVYANAAIDTSRVADGLVKYEYDGDLEVTSIHASLELIGGTRITPRFRVSPAVLPMNLGQGTYEFKVLQKMPDGKGMAIVEASSVLNTEIDEKLIYTSSTMEINFDASKFAIPSYKKLTDGLEENDAINKVYEDVVNNYTYDYDKMKAVVSKTIVDYRPVIDEIYEIKKGICYDYSAVLGGALRSQGVPVKLCKGYVVDTEVYHAWNEILVDGKWIVVDSTADAAYAEAGAPYKFAKDSKKYKATSYF